jgi:uncharacterized protein (DUF342 family)
MLVTETSPQQSEHVEWMNSLDFYTSYLKIIKDRMDALDLLDYSPQIESKKNGFSERLDYLFIQLNELSIHISEHLNEIEFEPVFENRLDRDLQFIHHQGIHDKIEHFENDLNDFRTAFNEFYVRWI